MLGDSWVEKVQVRSPVVCPSAKNAMSTLPYLSIDTLHQRQRADEVIGRIWEYWDCGRTPSKSQLPQEAKTVRRLLQLWHQLIECNGVLYRQITLNNQQFKQLLLPRELRQEVLNSLRDLVGHQYQQIHYIWLELAVIGQE